MNGEKPKTPYPYAGRGDEKPPDYGRVAAALTTSELEEEIEAGRGGAEYQAALQIERGRRGI